MKGWETCSHFLHHCGCTKEVRGEGRASGHPPGSTEDPLDSEWPRDFFLSLNPQSKEGTRKLETQASQPLVQFINSAALRGACPGRMLGPWPQIHAMQGPHSHGVSSAGQSWTQLCQLELWAGHTRITRTRQRNAKNGLRGAKEDGVPPSQGLCGPLLPPSRGAPPQAWILWGAEQIS